MYEPKGAELSLIFNAGIHTTASPVYLSFLLLMTTAADAMVDDTFMLVVWFKLKPIRGM